jgi:hypothetical protein
MSDDYEPSIDLPTTESGAESEAPARIEETAEDTGEVTGGPRGGRVLSDKVRAMFRGIAKAASESPAGVEGISDDLQPAIESSPAAAAASVEAAASPIAVPDVPAAAAVTPAPAPAPTPPMHDVGKAAAEQAKVLQELREKEYAAREERIAAREKELFSDTDLIERPGATLAKLLQKTYGATDAELKDIIEDVVTELSEHALGIQLPSDLKGRIDARKAVRSVKVYKADLTRREQQLQEQRAAADRAAAEAREQQLKEQAEAQAARQVSDLVATTRAEFKFLHAQEDPSGIVFTIVKDQHERGQPVDWMGAAKFANDYFRKQAEYAIKEADKLRSLLTPTAPQAPVPAKAATPTGGAPGPAPAAQPKPAPTPVAEDDGPANVDYRDQRKANLRKMLARTREQLKA